MELTEKTLSSEKIFDGVILHIRRDQVELPGGGRSVREVVDQVERILETEGLAGICGDRTVPSGLAMPRRQEIFACLNRC